MRLICTNCKEPLPTPEVAALGRELGAAVPDVLYRGKGCRQCQGTGYRGRTGIMELMLITGEIRDLLLRQAPASEIRKAAIENGMRSLRDDGWRHVRDGRTTIEEVMRVTKDERVESRLRAAAPGPAPEERGS